MKKLLLALLLLVGISQTYAKEKTRRINPGIRGGWNMSTVTGTEGDYRTNFYLGVQLPIRLAKFYELQPELVYSRQGADNINPSLVNYNYDRSGSNLQLDYVDINVINKFHFGRVNLQVGPGLAIATNSSNKNITPIDLTFNFGLGLDITSRLGVEARWMPGVVSINNGADTYYNGVQYIYDDYMRNNTFQVGAYFKF